MDASGRHILWESKAQAKVKAEYLGGLHSAQPVGFKNPPVARGNANLADLGPMMEDFASWCNEASVKVGDGSCYLRRKPVGGNTADGHAT